MIATLGVFYYPNRKGKNETPVFKPIALRLRCVPDCPITVTKKVFMINENLKLPFEKQTLKFQHLIQASVICLVFSNC